MKAVLISYNQALTDRVAYIIDRHSIRGFTKWEETLGRGTIDGEPHYGTHTWPAKNSTILVIVDDAKVEPLLESLRKLDAMSTEQGVRAFVWSIEGGM